MKQTRRRFVVAFVSGALIMPLTGLMLSRQARAVDLPKLSPDDPAAKSLIYSHESSDADRRCSGCQFYSGTADAEWGPCVIFPEKAVSARGVCNSWFKKVG